jgi:hypothetical protein
MHFACRAYRPVGCKASTKNNNRNYNPLNSPDDRPKHRGNRSMHRAIVQCIGAIVQCTGTIVQCSGAIVQCSGAIVQCSGAIVQCSGTIVQCSGTIVQCSGTIVQCSGTISQNTGRTHFKLSLVNVLSLALSFEMDEPYLRLIFYLCCMNDKKRGSEGERRSRRYLVRLSYHIERSRDIP